MLVTTMIHFAPRTIAQARAARARHLGRIARIGFRKLMRRIALLRERIALAWQYERELAVLLQSDDRMLADIGLTRGEVIASARSRWFTPGRLAEAAATRRRDAMRTAETRHARTRTLPHVSAPALSPGAPVRFLTVETSNFR